jgi:hypothetical protein
MHRYTSSAHRSWTVHAVRAAQPIHPTIDNSDDLGSVPMIVWSRKRDHFFRPFNVSAKLSLFNSSEILQRTKRLSSKKSEGQILNSALTAGNSVSTKFSKRLLAFHDCIRNEVQRLTEHRTHAWRTKRLIRNTYFKPFVDCKGNCGQLKRPNLYVRYVCPSQVSKISKVTSTRFYGTWRQKMSQWTVV